MLQTFECNVCLDIAKHTVVTSCGHIFCWPCLYQWLHLHSDHKECHVCKGNVTEANITLFMVGVPLKLGLRRQLLKGGIHVGRYLQDLMAIGLRVYGSRYRDRFQEGWGMR